MTTAKADLREGDRVAEKYTIHRLLGRGGMGSVYEVEDDEAGGIKALKIIHRSSFANDVRFAEFVRRAKREADALARLAGHPNVVQVVDSGYVNDTFWMVMEYLEGMDLGKLPSLLLRMGSLRIDVIVDWLAQACDAVGAAHQNRIIHRDIKPANIFLCSSGTVKVLDFGICKIAPNTELGEETDVSTILRTSKDFALSHGYAPLEQMSRPGQVDARADVFALGATLFRLLTGHYAYGKDAVDQISNMATGCLPRPLRSLRPDAPPELEHIVHRCLSLDPTGRFVDARELAQALRALSAITDETTAVLPPPAPSLSNQTPAPALPEAEGRPIPAESPRPHASLSPVTRWSVIATGVLVLLAVGFVAMRNSQSEAPPDDAVGDVTGAEATGTLSASPESSAADPPSPDPPSPPPAPGGTETPPDNTSEVAGAPPEPTSGATSKAAAPRRRPGSDSTGTGSPSANTTASASGSASAGLDEAAMRRSIEKKVWAGRGSIEEIRMLKAICSHQRDLPCRDKAAAMLKQREQP